MDIGFEVHIYCHTNQLVQWYLSYRTAIRIKRTQYPIEFNINIHPQWDQRYPLWWEAVNSSHLPPWNVKFHMEQIWLWRLFDATLWGKARGFDQWRGVTIVSVPPVTLGLALVPNVLNLDKTELTPVQATRGHHLQHCGKSGADGYKHVNLSQWRILEKFWYCFRNMTVDLVSSGPLCHVNIKSNLHLKHRMIRCL